MGANNLQPVTLTQPPADGRQSPTAMMVAQGVRRLLRAAGIASICEVVLSNARRADIFGIAADGSITIVEVKSSVQDFRCDSKWPEYIDYCDCFYFAAPADMDLSIFPSHTGLIVADSYGAEIVRTSHGAKLNSARRRSMLLTFARAAALQLHALHDPQSI